MLRVRKLAVVAIAALSVLIPASAPAYAQATPSASDPVVWVEKNPPPARGTMPQFSTFASGGGCQNTGDLRVCISWTNTTLKGDFYRNSFNSSIWCKARVYIINTGRAKYKYTTTMNHLGHYPIATEPTSGSGTAATEADVYTCSDSFIQATINPGQRYP